MRGSLWICTLSAVLMLIPMQFMTVNADPSTGNQGKCSRNQLQSLSGYQCQCPTGFSPRENEAVTCDLIAPGESQSIELSCNKTEVSIKVFTCGCRMNPRDRQQETVNITCNGYGLLRVNHIRCKDIQVAPSSTQRPHISGSQVAARSTPNNIQVAPSSTQRPNSIQGAPSSTQPNISGTQVAARSTPNSIQGAPSSTQPNNVQVAPSSTQPNKRRKSAWLFQVLMISGTIAGTLTPITIIIVVFVRHRYIRNKRMTSNPGTTLAYSTGETAIQIEREADQDSPCCSNETPHTSIPKYVTKSEAVFTSAGGELNAPFDSNVRIIIPKGAIPAGANQPVFFGVFLDEIPLLRDIPEEPNTTLISPVVECGPHDIKLSNPVEIIVPHCLCLSKAKKKWIKVYRCGNFVAGCEGLLSWERVPNKSEKNSQSKSWFTVGKDSIRIKTKAFSLWSIFACGGPTRKRATVFASRPDPKSDLIYIRFYVYSDNEDSKRRVEVKDRERFPDSKPAREQPFRMYKDNKDITVKLTDLEEGWEFDKTNDTQIYHYDKASGNLFRSKNACDFAVKPEDSRDVNGFSCMVKFEQEDDQQEYSIYLNPGFTPLKRQSIRVKPAAGDQSLTASSNTSAIAGCSTSKGTEEEGCHSHIQEGESSPDSSRDKGCAQCDHFQFTSLGLGNGKPVTENLLYGISPYVGVMWKPLLRNLSIKEAIIRNLEEDYRNASVDEKCYQGLLAWKNSQGPQGATIKTLWDALVVVPGCSEAINALRSEIAPRISHC